ncbi:uncharacterized protein SPPG_04638 [Spizellomyces punctatus DAOM BR117]|uniref:Uncharacterized protein n=1 Tax=Spizellomyces punctatus (strain DAOM BR117) TaxID=645134 RepID=A0A0L0HHK8_SPIPD|nr:uncharacterized protein SPPG_04638 [Spizellomyces punctatus DAOM BR117]KND00314.1 hypothetical protein SPPG_04638 [Spizellomyces punctatus DAOM BR117]|eukprot:XP_016608353.1 hypothetical protein SPPG_04638 [Spizellomyces punctatus DAOM BR117]
MFRDCRTPPPLPKKTTTAAAEKEGTSLPIYEIRHSPPTKKVYHYGRFVPEYHAPLAPVPTIPSPSAVTWPSVYIPGSPELPPGLSHEMEWELAYIDRYWQKKEHKEEQQEAKQKKEPKMPYWALSTVGGRDHLWHWPVGIGPRKEYESDLPAARGKEWWRDWK